MQKEKDSEPTLKKTFEQLEKEKIEAEKKWEQIQKEEKVKVLT